jgi:oligosaccharide translocation protein RFT1
MITWFTSLTAQGVYALASNYGSILARVLFQPIEESSRTVFGRLLASSNTEQSPENLKSAREYLITLVHAYSLLSLFITTVGPTLAPILLHWIAGPKWHGSAAGATLSLYCYYIPLLAFNGILEAFISAVATPSQLTTQSVWMIIFSATFAVSSYVLMDMYDLGAFGLIGANSVNMGLRIIWSWNFIRQWFNERGVVLGLEQALPDAQIGVLGLSCGYILRKLRKGFEGDIGDLIRTLVIASIYALFV